ncbi:MAG: GerAB/ArcD/ProY family transporter [Christensenellales bacterium]|nr:GerAB/ArcD/ProY family transporter [Christensenellales bacterium]
MRLTISDGSAASLVCVAGIVRIFSDVVMNGQKLYNSGWIAVLLGGLFTLPIALAASLLKRTYPQGSALTRPKNLLLRRLFSGFFLLLSIVYLLLAAGTTRTISTTANFIALTNSVHALLLLPQLAVCALALCAGGTAIGESAHLWKKILAALLLLVIVLRISVLRPGWLYPLLGPGWPDLFSSGLRIAGKLSLLFSACLLSQENPRYPRRLSPLRILAVVVGLSSAMLLLRSMQIPPMTDGKTESSFFQLSTLLTNGTAPLTMQLPLIVLWFVGLFFLLLFDSWMGATLLSLAIPSLPHSLVMILSVSGVCIGSILGNSLTTEIAGSPTLLYGSSLLLFLSLLLQHRSGGEPRNA